MPMLTNFNTATKSFDGNLIHELLNNPAKQQQFIHDLDTLSNTISKVSISTLKS